MPITAQKGVITRLDFRDSGDVLTCEIMVLVQSVLIYQ